MQNKNFETEGKTPVPVPRPTQPFEHASVVGSKRTEYMNYLLQLASQRQHEAKDQDQNDQQRGDVLPTP